MASQSKSEGAADAREETGRGTLREAGRPATPAAAETLRSGTRRRRGVFELAITRADESLSIPDPWQRAAQVAVIGLFAISVVAVLYITQSVVVPLVLAWVFGTILAPFVTWLDEHGVPRIVGAVLVMVLVLAVVIGLFTLLTLPLTYWLGRASEIGSVIKSKLELITEPFAFMKELSRAITEATRAGDSGGALRVEGAPPNIVAGILAFVTPAVSQGILFLGALVFYLIFQKAIRNEGVLIFPSRRTRLIVLRIVNDIERNIGVYFGTFTMVNIVLGAVTSVMVYLVGLPNPLLWGVLAMVLNYIPYLGVAVMVGVLLVIGLFTFPQPAQALIAPIAYVGLTTIEGQFITPAVMGRRMTLNPFAVFVAIGCWTWLWGPIGAFLAVPMLMIVTVIVRHLVPDEEPRLPD